MASRSPQITTRYIAAVLHKDPEYVRRLVRAGLFQAQKQMGKSNAKWIIDKASFETWLVSIEYKPELEGYSNE